MSKQAHALREKAEKIEEQEYMKNQYPKEKKLLGKCYKYRNSYSCPESEKDYWWVYKQVVDIKPHNITSSCFQETRDGEFKFDKNKWFSVGLDHVPISKNEFEKAKQAFIKRLKEKIKLNFKYL